MYHMEYFRMTRILQIYNSMNTMKSIPIQKSPRIIILLFISCTALSWNCTSNTEQSSNDRVEEVKFPGELNGQDRVLVFRVLEKLNKEYPNIKEQQIADKLVQMWNYSNDNGTNLSFAEFCEGFENYLNAQFHQITKPSFEETLAVYVCVLINCDASQN